MLGCRRDHEVEGTHRLPASGTLSPEAGRVDRYGFSDFQDLELCDEFQRSTKSTATLMERSDEELGKSGRGHGDPLVALRKLLGLVQSRGYPIGKVDAESGVEALH